MDRNPVKSSNIKSIGYDTQQQILEIEFTSGGVYQYSGVEQSAYDALEGASSVGSYFYQHIKPKYSCTKV